MEEEAPKVANLIPKGAKRYYILTNVPGTSHLETGSIDKVDAIFRKKIPIEAFCLWRDDLNRRLDSQFDLKWAYPELLKGSDILRAILEQGTSPTNFPRLSTVLRAFLSDQFENDKHVRFKQVDIQNDLLDLFVDVPINLFGLQHGHRLSRTENQILGRIAQELMEEEEVESEFEAEATVGAAAFLLHPLVAQHFPWIVLEGAPGQGKSTVVQYVCQVYRSKVLSQPPTQSLYPQHALPNARIPVKVDLRDLSLWLSRRDPFSADNAEIPAEKFERSLEGFLSAVIAHHSGEAPFGVADLQECARCLSLLLVFDGLDEVADLSKRRVVVEEISKGLNRLASFAASVQVVITSRPTAFVGSPSFSQAKFCYIDLSSISKRVISEYAEKWIRAKKLDAKDASAVHKILKEKVDLPHLRSSPEMQCN